MFRVNTIIKTVCCKVSHYLCDMQIYSANSPKYSTSLSFLVALLALLAPNILDFLLIGYVFRKNYYTGKNGGDILEKVNEIFEKIKPFLVQPK